MLERFCWLDKCGQWSISSRDYSKHYVACFITDANLSHYAPKERLKLNHDSAIAASTKQGPKVVATCLFAAPSFSLFQLCMTKPCLSCTHSPLL